MILYSLTCHKDHSFDSWFASAEAFGGLQRAGQLTCPTCGSGQVEKSLMAPAVRPKPTPKRHWPRCDGRLKQILTMSASISWPKPERCTAVKAPNAPSTAKQSSKRPRPCWKTAFQSPPCPSCPRARRIDQAIKARASRFCRSITTGRSNVTIRPPDTTARPSTNRSLTVVGPHSINAATGSHVPAD